MLLHTPVAVLKNLLGIRHGVWMAPSMALQLAHVGGGGCEGLRAAAQFGCQVLYRNENHKKWCGERGKIKYGYSKLDVLCEIISSVF